MKMKFYSLVLFFLSIVVFTSCKPNEENKALEIQIFDKDSILLNDPVLKKADSVANTTTKEDKNKPVTSIKFDKEVFDFGECTEGDKIIKKIEFTNTGKLPLVINQAYGSCGCTVPKYDKEPIAPGKKGQIDIEFDSKNKPGANTKSVMIEANTNPPITTITFSVKVNTKTKKK